MVQPSSGESPEFYQRILDGLPLSIAVLNGQGDILETNSEWENFGLENDIDPAFLEPGTNYLQVCSGVQDEYASEAHDKLTEILSGDRKSFSMEYPCHSPNEKRWFLMKAAPLEGFVETYVLVVHLDITQRIESERELRHKEKLASIGEMSAGIMHEINNPNTFISGNVEYLLKRLSKLNSELEDFSELPGEYAEFLSELETVLGDVLSGAERITRIVNKVEQFAQKQAAEENKATVTEVSGALEETVRRVERIRSVDFIELENELSQTEVERSVFLSPDEFSTIVKNVLDNAVTAVLERDPPDPEVCVQATPDETILYLRILDNGVGIDDEVLSSVKDPFFTTKSVTEGTGLGLAIVSNLVKKIDGDVDIYSKSGEGTWVFIELPLVSTD